MELLYAIAIILAGGGINYFRGGNLVRPEDRPAESRFAFMSDSVPTGVPAAILMGVLAGAFTSYGFEVSGMTAETLGQLFADPGKALFGAAFGLVFLLWSTPGWGRWHTLGRFFPSKIPMQPDESKGEYRQKAPSAHEAAIDRIVGTNQHLGWLIRMAFATPMLAALAWAVDSPLLMVAAFVFPFVMLGAAELAWRLWERGIYLDGNRFHAHGVSEFLCGLVWGAIIALYL